eukprot:gene1662-1818_t
MQQVVVRLSILFLLFTCLIWAKTNRLKQARSLSKQSPNREESNDDSNDAAMELAKFLHRNKGSANDDSSSGSSDSGSIRKISDSMENYEIEEIARAIRSLMTAQNAWKSMDAATHQLRNTFKESASLSSRYEKFRRSKSKNRKEAAKLLEYVTAAERGMQAAEILQSLYERNSERRKEMLLFAGLEELARLDMQENKVHLSMFILRPIATDDDMGNEILRFSQDELVVAFIDNVRSPGIGMAQLLRMVSKEGCQRVSLVEESTATDNNSNALPIHEAPADNPSKIIVLQPTMARLAIQASQALEEFVNKEVDALVTSAANVSNETVDVASLAVGGDDERNQTHHWPLRVRFVGHSAGGAVASYLAMLLHGTLPLHCLLACDPSQSTPLPLKMPKNYRGKVKCVTLGCLPCLSHQVVPRYITSLICGDDVIARAQPDAIASFRRRVLRALEAGAGKKGFGWLVGGSVLKDISSMAGKSLTRYRTSKKASSSPLDLPGRVFFMKNRQLKQGATLQRILRGNWQEDVLWKVHDIPISGKMLEHHGLDAYIRTLNRC